MLHHFQDTLKCLRNGATSTQSYDERLIGNRYEWQRSRDPERILFMNHVCAIVLVNVHTKFKMPYSYPFHR